MMNSILVGCNDLDLRIHHRSQMEAAGLHRILELMRSLGHIPLDKLLKIFQQTLDGDEKKLRERLDQELLRDLESPEDVLTAIQARIGNLKAKDYLLSTLRHLLLIGEEGAALTRYYQLVDSAVADIVLDKKPAGAEHGLGQTDEDDGLVGKFKGQITRLEEGLRVSRASISLLQGNFEEQRAGYEEQIAQLELQITELYIMLKDTGMDVWRYHPLEARGPEIWQRRVNEMDEANPSTFFPSHSILT